MLDDQELFARPFSVGRPVVGSFLRRDDTGELWVRSPLLFSGYLDDPEATAAALVDGWYRTGDLVERDDDGFHFVVGRTQELIRSGGESIAPVEVEAALLGCAGVLDAAVAGVPDDDWGEVVTAFVVDAPGATVTLAGLQDAAGDDAGPPEAPPPARAGGGDPAHRRHRAGGAGPPRGRRPGAARRCGGPIDSPR